MESRLSIKMILFLFFILYVAVPYRFNWSLVMATFPDDPDRFLLHGLVALGRQVGIVLLALVSIAMILREESRRVNISGSLGGAIVIFIIVAIMSLAWSEVKDVTFKRLLIFISLWLAAFAISKTYSYSDIALLTMSNCLLTLVLSVGAEVVLGTFTPFSDDYRFAGVIHPNSQGINCSLMLISALAYLIINDKVTTTRRLWTVFIMILSILFLLLTKSRTALFSAAFALSCSFLLYCLTARKHLVPILACVIIPLQLFALYFVYDNDIIAGVQDMLMLGRKTDVKSLTGRTDMWQDLLAYSAQNPLLGYGYNSFWTPDHLSEMMGIHGGWVGSEHSSYLNTLMGLGVVGLIPFVIMLALSVRASVGRYVKSKKNEFFFPTTIIVMAIINMVTETILFYFSLNSLIILVAIVKLSHDVSISSSPYDLEAYERDSDESTRL